MLSLALLIFAHPIMTLLIISMLLKKDLSQEGQCLLHGRDASMVGKAKTVVMDLVADIEEGGVYDGTIIEVKDFGAVVELLRNKQGLLHVSEMTDKKDIVNNPAGNLGVVKSFVKVGDRVRVLCIGVDPIQGLIKLSQRQLTKDQDPLFDYSSIGSESSYVRVGNVKSNSKHSPSNQKWMMKALSSSVQTTRVRTGNKKRKKRKAHRNRSRIRSNKKRN